MFGYLRGELKLRNKDSLIIDVSGVGYEVLPSSTLSKNGIKLGDELEVIIYTDVKESSITLYGFSTMAEREVFLLLRKVKGVGSKLSISAINQLGAEGILGAIAKGENKALVKISGLGPKTAKRIILELGEEVEKLVGSEEEGSGYSPLADAIQIDQISDSSAISDTYLALAKLGFDEKRREQAISKSIKSLGPKVNSMSASELLKDALKNL